MNGVRREKRLLARAMALTGLSDALITAQSVLLRGGHIRVVSFHGTPAEHAESFERQVAWFAARYCPVTLADLERFFRDGAWVAPKPGLVISFDDGLRSNYDIAAPVLERHGFTGWFFVPLGFVDCPVEEQFVYACDHQIQVDRAPADGRVALSRDELRALSRRHVIGCHTRTHCRLSAAVPPARLEDEIVATRSELESVIEGPVEVFAWVGGEEKTYSAEAARVVRRAGYRFAFMTNTAPLLPGSDPLQIQRTNLESDWSLDVVGFQLSGVMDALYTPKRARVNRLTAR